MKKRLLSCLLLGFLAPMMSGMDNSRYARARRSDKDDQTDTLFQVLQTGDQSGDGQAVVIDVTCGEGADPNMATMVSDQYGTRMTPPLASVGGRIALQAVEKLLDHGANPNAIVYQKARDSEYYRAMPLLAWFVDRYLNLDEQYVDIIHVRQIIRRLIARGACVNDFLAQCIDAVRNKSCHTVTQGPLIVHILRAAQGNPFSRLVDAIDCGATKKITVIYSEHPELINQRDEFGFTPLGYALLRSWGSNNLDRQVVLALLSLGARAQDLLYYEKGSCCRQRPALDIARDSHWADVIQMIEEQEQQQLRQQAGADFECPICFEPLKQDTVLRRVNCGGGHIFCKKCVQTQTTCPLCRLPIR